MSDTNSRTPINTNPTISNNITSTNTTRVSPGSSTTSSASQACAACKYQRRRCVPDCPLAAYFPPNQPRIFHNVHKLFGVSNFLKLLRSVQPSLQGVAAKSMVVQANIRANDVIGGCYRIICELERQIEQSKAEFVMVLRQLVVYRAAQAERACKMENPSFVDIDALGVYNPMHAQTVDFDGRFQVQDPPLYMPYLGCYDYNVGVNLDYMEASTRVVNDSNQIFIDESEDVKPLVNVVTTKSSEGFAFDSESKK